MMHVKQIEGLILEGDTNGARSALENLLALGPNNTGALKLQAKIYASEGRFKEEESVWMRILEIDREDPEAINFAYQRQIEDREHYYFTDDLPDGRRRFLAYPRSLVSVSILGFLGCVAFLLLSKASQDTSFAENDALILGAFSVLVITPWVGIVYLYCSTIRSFSLGRAGFELATRFRSHRFDWNELDHVYLSHSDHPEYPDLRLVFIPKSPDAKVIELDMTDTTSAIRARIHLINEVKELYPGFDYISRSQLQIPEDRILSY